MPHTKGFWGTKSAFATGLCGLHITFNGVTTADTRIASECSEYVGRLLAEKFRDQALSTCIQGSPPNAATGMRQLYEQQHQTRVSNNQKPKDSGPSEKQIPAGCCSRSKLKMATGPTPSIEVHHSPTRMKVRLTLWMIAEVATEIGMLQRVAVNLLIEAETATAFCSIHIIQLLPGP